MNKKIGALFLFAILFSSLVFAVSLDTVEQGVGSAEEKLDQAKSFTDEEKWGYLGDEWRDIFLENKFISGVDSFLKDINPVFLILLGENYSLSLTLFFVLIFWIFILLVVFFVIKDYLGIIEKKWICFLIGVVVSSLIAQSGAYRIMAETTFKFLFFKGGFLDYISLILFLVIILVLMDLVRGFGKKFKAQREHIDEEMAKQDRYILSKIVKIFTDSLSSEKKK